MVRTKRRDNQETRKTKRGGRSVLISIHHKGRGSATAVVADSRNMDCTPSRRPNKKNDAWRKNASLPGMQLWRSSCQPSNQAGPAWGVETVRSGKVVAGRLAHRTKKPVRGKGIEAGGA